MKRNRRLFTISTTIRFVLSVVWVLCIPVTAVQYVDDFDYAKPGSNSWSNGIFQHNIVPIPPLDHESWNISDSFSPPSGTALNLCPAMDEITFDLKEGEYIDYASIEVISYSSVTAFEVVGDLDTYKVDFFYNGGIWEFADTSGQDIGHITMIRLISSEGAFDNLTVNVAPEPGTIFLFGLGVLAVRRHKL